MSKVDAKWSKKRGTTLYLPHIKKDEEELATKPNLPVDLVDTNRTKRPPALGRIAGAPEGPSAIRGSANGFMTPSTAMEDLSAAAGSGRIGHMKTCPICKQTFRRHQHFPRHMATVHLQVRDVRVERSMFLFISNF